MIEVTNHNSFNFGPGNTHEENFRVFVSELGKVNYDFLIFTDSKGLSKEHDVNTWTQLLANKFNEEGISSLIVIRPKEITVFFTLINFLELNKVKFNYLITNLGFVDLTPKKRVFIDDIVQQTPHGCDIYEDTYIPLCDYMLNTGNVETLYTLDYSKIVKNISTILSSKFKYSYLLEIFEFQDSINIERKRPREFYIQLKQSNKLIREICAAYPNLNNIKVDSYLPPNHEEVSYDAVHFTEYGHKLIYKIVKKAILY